MTTLKLVYTQDNQAVPSDTLDLLCFTGEVGFQIANNGWVPVIGRGKMQESLTLHAKGDDQDEVITYLESLLKKWQNYVLWSQDFTQERSVWLQVQWEDETNTRQARLTSFDFQINSSPFGEFWQDANFTEATLTFERLEWEETNSLGQSWGSFFVPAGLSTLGVSQRVNGIISPDNQIPKGDVNSRIIQMLVKRTAGFNPSTIWMGWRRNTSFAPDKFIPRWECELGTPVGADTTATANATASNSSCMTTTFATTATLQNRFSIMLADVLSNAGYPSTSDRSQRGKFLVLLRAKLSAAGSVNTRVAFGNLGALNIMPRVNITSTTWTFYELGSISIPAARVPKLITAVESAVLKDYRINIDAERVSGSCSLLCDCLVLIPLDESYLKLALTGTARVGTDFYVFQNDLNDVSGYAGDTDVMDTALATDQYRWGVPPYLTSAGVYLVFATDPGALADTTEDMTIYYIPRWQLARGDE